MREAICTDDLPDFILEGFQDVKQLTGSYPDTLVLGWLLAEMMHARPGVWKCARPGVWKFTRDFLTPSEPDDMDEFGMPD